MQKIRFPAAAAILALLIGCAPEAHEDLLDELGENRGGDSGAEVVGDDGSTSSTQSDAGAATGDAAADSATQPSNDAGSSAQGDAGSSSTDSGTSTDSGNSTDSGASTDSGTSTDSGSHDAGSSQDSGSTQTDSGTQQPQPTVVWSKRHVATTNLGAVTTQPYHRARFTFTSNGCTINADSPFYPTGWTGSSILTLTSAQQACLREQFDCSIKAKVQWGSCASAGCGSLSAGLNWETERPACSVSIPSGKVLSLRVTVAQLGAGGIDETWEVVTP